MPVREAVRAPNIPSKKSLRSPRDSDQTDRSLRTHTLERKLETKMMRTRERLLELGLSALVAALFLASSASHAATRAVVAGQLVGASNVNVGGVLYDAAFVEGTCISVFDGCDSEDDFTFTDLATVNLASQALLDQVFLDVGGEVFDTDPTSTSGCTNEAVCSSQTPYSPVGGDDVNAGVALNNAVEESDVIADITAERAADSAVGLGQFYMWAVWTPSAVQPATLEVVGGQLVGASNVDVGGTLYDVAFVEGTCISVFDGCDSADDFAFSDLATANLASQALVDQVFLDVAAGNFDTEPASTFGCTHATVGSVQTPYAVIDVESVAMGVALNTTPETGDGIGNGPNGRTTDSALGAGQFYVLAVWTPVAAPTVPAVPGPGRLVLLGLIAVGAWISRPAR